MRDVMASAADRDPVLVPASCCLSASALPVSGIDPVLTSSFENRMAGNEAPTIEDTDRVGQLMHFDETPRAVRHAVVISADRHEPIMADPTFQFQERIEDDGGQRLQISPLGRKGLRHDPLRGRVQPHIGDRIKPVLQLRIEVVEIAERTSEEEVFADVTEGALHLTLRFCSISPTGARMEPVMFCKREKRSVVDDVAFVILARHGGLHPVVQDLHRHAADRFEGRHVTAQQRLQVLMQDKARFDVPGMPEHHREQPHDPCDARFVLEGDDKAGEVDLRLMARRRLEPNLEGLWPIAWPDRRDKALYPRIGARVATFA
jgi:hypothetical protein